MPDSNDTPPEPIEITKPAVQTTTLIGRDEELKHIRERLDEVRSGHGGGLALQGESGIGKTELAKAVAGEAETAGIKVVYASCRGTALRPYQPLVDAVYGLLDMAPSRPRDLQQAQLRQMLDHLGLSDHLTAFADLLNLPIEHDEWEIATAVKTPGSTTDQPDFPQAVRRLVEAMTRKGTHMLLIFDDLDQSHPATQSALAQLAEELLPIPALLLVTFGPDPSPALEKTFARSVIELEGLDAEHSSMLHTLFLEGASLASAMNRKLRDHTGGNPYFTRVLIEELQSGQRLVRGKSGQLKLADDVHLPELDRLLLYRFQQLNEEQQRSLQFAAVLGDGFRIGALSTLQGRAYSDTIFQEVSRLVKMGWLTRSGEERLSTYTFPQRIIREVIYQDIEDGERKQLHRRAADYYAVPSTGRRLRVEYALHHYLAIDDTQRALEVVEMSLAQARQTGNRQQMVEGYRLGAEVASRSVHLIDKQAAMAEALGDIYAVEGNYRKAAIAYSELAPTTAPPTLLSKLGLVLLDFDSARAANVLAQVSPAIPRNYPNDLFWRVEAGLIWALAESDRIYDGIRRSRDILGSLGEAAGFGSARTLLRGTLGMALFYHDDPVEAQAHLESARAGWGARGEQDGIMLINQILIRLPRDQITRLWLNFVMKPLLSHVVN